MVLFDNRDVNMGSVEDAVELTLAGIVVELGSIVDLGSFAVILVG